MSFIRISVLSAVMISLSACATTPDPAKVCTADWIGKRSDKAVSRIETRAKPALKKLSKAAEKWAKGGKPNAFQLMSLNSSVNNLTRELKSGQAMKDLKMLSRTCNDPKIVSGAMTNLMHNNGLSDSMIDFVERLPMFKEIIESEISSAPQTVTSLYTPAPTMMHH